MKQLYRNHQRSTQIRVGKNVFLPFETKITVPELEIGAYSRLNGPIVVRGQENCFIGKYCALGYHITIITTNHDITRPNLQINMQRSYGFKSLEISKGPVKIGNNVWIGDNVTILSGVSIGDGCVIGAGAVVTQSIAPFKVAAGIPAKVRKDRFDHSIIRQMLEIKWWDWSEEKIGKNQLFFDTDLTQCSADDLKKIIVE